MATISEAFAIAVGHHRAGRLRAAEESYRQILAADPNHAHAWSLLGVVNSQLGNHQVAADCIGRAIELAPKAATFHCNLGDAYQRAKKHHEAVACYCRALELKPDFAEAHFNLGTSLHEQGKRDDAVACFHRALEAKPDFAEAYNNLGTILREQGKRDEAAQCYRQALELNPDYAEAHNNLGNALRHNGQWTEAIACYRRAVELNPDYAEARNHLGNAFYEQGQRDEAVACYRRALEQKPDFAEAHFNLGNVLRDKGQRDEAIACYRRAVELKPDYGLALGTLTHELQHLCDWKDIEPLSQRVIEFVDQGAKDSIASPVSPFAFLALPTVTTAEQQLRCARQWHDRRLKTPVEIPRGPAWNRSATRNSKLTVGYLSADFHSHATAQLTAELFERHDRDRFSIIGYSLGPDDGSPMRRRLVNAFDRFVDLKHASFRESAERIAADGVQIAVDLKGYTTDSRTEILALRPAPIQVNYLGYPGTMGTSFMDYILVDDFVVPSDQQPYYTEQLVHLPGCYQVNDSQREISPRTPSRAECGLPLKGFVFCCFNNNYKITPAVFGAWMRLLQAVPGSVLWLLEGNRFAPPNLRREAEARGVAADRLVFAPRLPLAEHLARHRQADLFLDTFPVNAHTTASEALWAGCPVVTIAGPTFVSRVAGSLLRALGLHELIMTSLMDYEAAALRLARNADLLGDLRSRLEAKHKHSRLFDGVNFAQSLEKAYETFWQIYANGEKPRALAIPAA